MSSPGAISSNKSVSKLLWSGSVADGRAAVLSESLFAEHALCLVSRDYRGGYMGMG